MKRELAAAALLLLLITGAVWNVHSADRLTETVERSLHRAELAARRGDYGSAMTALENGMQVWDAHGTYTRIFFRHPDLDAIQDAFHGLEERFLQEDPAWPAALDLLRSHLSTVDEMEHVTLGTVF
jgi:hypothetical protein